jgi:hypothetical protein
VIGGISVLKASENMMRISAKADLREKLAASIMNLMEQLQLDGLFLEWMWPGCPMVHFFFGWTKTLGLICPFPQSNGDDYQTKIPTGCKL